jgi:hypothetical protein
MKRVPVKKTVLPAHVVAAVVLAVSVTIAVTAVVSAADVAVTKTGTASSIRKQGRNGPVFV